MNISDTAKTTLPAEQISLLPTEEDVQFFEEHGWYISPKIIPDDVIEQALIGCDRFYRGEKDAELPNMEMFANWQPKDGNDVLRNNEFVARQIKEFQPLAFNPLIGAMGARLTRSKTMRLWEEQIIYKPSQTQGWTGSIGWHTDLAYCSFCTSNKIVAAWIPLHDCDESMGPLVVIDGSHKWEDVRDLKTFQVENLEEIEEKLQQSGKKITKVPMSLKKGQLSFHHGWTIHGSYPNRSNRPRIVMAVHLQDGDNSFQAVQNPKGGLFHHYIDPFARQLPNGFPDYTDPNIYPTLWST